MHGQLAASGSGLTGITTTVISAGKGNQSCFSRWVLDQANQWRLIGPLRWSRTTLTYGYSEKACPSGSPRPCGAKGDASGCRQITSFMSSMLGIMAQSAFWLQPLQVRIASHHRRGCTMVCVVSAAECRQETAAPVPKIRHNGCTPVCSNWASQFFRPPKAPHVILIDGSFAAGPN